GLPTFPPNFPPGPLKVAMFQNHGDTDTEYVVHGFGWPPGGSVTVTVAGDGSARENIVVDRAGTFNCVIGHDPVFFTGPIPLGWHRIVVTIPGVGTARTRFHVTPGPPGSGLPAGPPPGNAPAAVIG
ncbi:MAG: hypothetical protein ACRDRJ_20490, partial [Streptosporangiaceae bacterium]